MGIEINPAIVIGLFVGLAFALIFGFAKKRDHEKNLAFFKLVWQKGFTAVNEQHNFVKPKWFRGPPSDIMPQNAFLFLRNRRSQFHFLSKKRNAYIFNYQYTTQSGKNSHTYHFFCYLCKTEKQLPKMEIRAENILEKLIKPLYSKDIPIPADSEWSKRFLVKGENEAQVQSFITPSIIERFQSSKYSLFTLNNELLMVYAKRQHSVDEQLKFIEDAEAIEQLITR